MWAFLKSGRNVDFFGVGKIFYLEENEHMGYMYVFYLEKYNF
jgi:hypothetical protein